ncbi:MBL fold metallo-hydrolase [Citricoccus sp. SGAir0253]|uniref:MBL fold metallo-hydrolase n=1 Tax=Citricoccus sp. SGAir0253 TaxID=2567881 RepID=UPI0010CD4662|nr:MBL fold metallo-hydrolase [Citricoccus sp. SGAir0253]QCU77385.1 MBL fold metallo-hydrolase [Citricoccus sp. SGAir0253]
MAQEGWTRLTEHVHTLALPGWQANMGLVVGRRAALLVDTGAGPRQAARLLAGVRELTALPLVAVNTHAHFDHVFGNAYLADPGTAGVVEIWGHERAAAALREHGEDQRGAVAGPEPDFAARRGAHAAILPPTRTVAQAPHALDLGGVTATLLPVGRGHTDGDLMVGAEGVLFAGDLVEEGADPAFEDAFPRDWVAALEEILALTRRYPVVVPGHGAVVGADHVRSQREAMALAVDGRAAPYGPEQSRHLASRLS